MPRGRPRKNPEEVLMRGAEMIGWALGGLEREIMLTKQRLSTLTSQAAQLRGRLAGNAPGRGPAAVATFEEPGVAAPGRKRRRRRMSAEARKRISDMMKKRWAERRKR